MNKLLITTLWTLLFLLLIILGFFLFIFSQTGNDMLKPYIKQALEEKIGMPVEVDAVRLEPSMASLDFTVNKQAAVKAVSQYDIWKQSIEGIYQVKADEFTYEEKKFKQVDLKGNFKYLREDAYIDGNGTALDAKMDYRLNIIDNLPQQALINVKEAQLAEVLQLLGQPAVAQGKIDVNVHIPDMGDTKNIYGHAVLKGGKFNRALVKELYHYTLPEKSYVHGKVDAKLKGRDIRLTGDVQSNLFMLKIKNVLVSMLNEKGRGEYDLDVKDMRILTQNKLAGPLKLAGKIEKEGKRIQVTSDKNSLRGKLHLTTYIGGKNVQIKFEKLAVEKLLPLLKQPAYAKGELSGNAGEFWDVGVTSYALNIDKGILNAKVIEKMSQYKIPVKNTFSLQTKGRKEHKKLTGSATLHSTLADMTLSSLKYDFEKKILDSNYDVLLHDVNRFTPNTQAKKGASVSAEGKLKYTDRLAISGKTKGLGKKVAFSYDGKTATVDASQLFVEKILALAGVPVYVKGTLDSQIMLTNLKPSEGTFTIKSTNLSTEPNAMKKLIGEALKVNIALDTSGTFKKGKGYIGSKIKSSLGDLTLDNMIVDTEKKSFKSSYVLDVPRLEKWHKVIDRKLYGPLVLKGEWLKEKVLTMTGQTSTLGGKIDYKLVGDALHSTVNSVPLENILGILGHPKNFLGKASGKGKYHLKQKLGVVDLDIASFQIKSSSITNTIKMVIGKDPARVIFPSTKFHADIKGKVTDYTLHAKGSHSSIDIIDGRIDKLNNTNTAKFKFVYEKYTVNGRIKGTIDDPKITIDTSALLQDKVKEKINDTLQDKKVQEKIEKVLGGKAGEFLKGLKF